MKKIYYLFCLVVLVIFSACTHEQEDLFNDSSAQRADAAIKTTIETLTNPSNGWLMEYFPASMQEHGGYNIILAFNTDGKVEVASEVADPMSSVSSLYSVKQSSGIVLSFDSYNDIFHAFSDPSAPLGGDKGYGLEGDYDFLILEVSNDKIVLKGKKTGGIAILTPIQMNWGEYLTSIQVAEKDMNFSQYKLEIDGQEVSVMPSGRTLIFSYQESGSLKSVTASYVVTPTGYKFYEPITINEKELSGFIFDKTNNYFVEVNNSNILLVPIIPPLNEQFVAGNWYIAYSQLGVFGQTYFDKVKEGEDAVGEVLQLAFIGSSLYGKFGFNFYSSGYKGLLGLSYELIGENQISLVFDKTADGDGIWYHNNANFAYALFPFGYSSSRTFTLATDNLKAPSYITLTEDSNPENKITLSATQVIFPFDN